jgi:hypothetical protein
MSLGDTPAAAANGGPTNGNQGLTSPVAAENAEEIKQVQEVLASEVSFS